MKTVKLDPKKTREVLRDNFADADIGAMQIAIYVACGGGWIGEMHAKQPADSYVDLRVGKLPYSRTAINNMRIVLIEMAEARGLDPRNLPTMPKLHNCGVL